MRLAFLTAAALIVASCSSDSTRPAGRTDAAAGSGRSTPQTESTLAEVLQRPVPLRDGIGQASEPVTTSSPRAQAFYNQGLAYLHSFVWIEAARSFNQAIGLDPDLAMAHLGLSYALGELRLQDQARASARQARTLGARATEREQLRIELRVKQVEAAADPENAAARSGYRTELDRALAKYPADVEFLLLVGQAQEPADHAHGMGAGSRSLPFYERAIAQAPDYFAIHHYMTHAYENVNQIDSALVHAERYVRAADQVPHAHHMYGHVLRRVDRIDAAIAEFVKADELEAAYLKEERIPPRYDWHYRHNLNLLGTTYQSAGRLRSAEPVLRRAFEIASADPPMRDLDRTEWPSFLLARGRAAEALAAADSLTVLSPPLVEALGQLMAGHALLALGRPDAAAERGNLALGQMRSSGPLGGVLLPEFQLVQGEFLLRTGRMSEGRSMLRDAAAKLRAQSGPDAWVETLFSLEEVARVARELNDWVLAGEFADQMRVHDAKYAGTDYALALVAEHNGDRPAARALYADAVRRWAGADPDLPELLDARRRLAVLPAH